MTWFRRSVAAEEADAARDARWLAQVARRHKAGVEALMALVDAYQADFVRGVRYQGLSQPDADDVMQTFWETIWKDAGNYGPGHGRPVQWLHGLYRPDRYQYEMQLSRVGSIDAKVWVSKALAAQFH